MFIRNRKSHASLEDVYARAHGLITTKIIKNIFLGILTIIFIGIGSSVYATDSSSDVYVPDIYLTGISLGTRVSKLKEKIDGEIELYDKNNKKLLDSSILKTGAFLKYGEQNFKVVVEGDITGTGQCTITDLMRLKSYLIGIKPLDNESELAADINRDGKITITDMASLKSQILRVITAKSIDIGLEVGLGGSGKDDSFLTYNDDNINFCQHIDQSTKTSPATCQEEGKSTVYCKDCGNEFGSVKLSKVEHVYAQSNDSAETYCIWCNKMLPTMLSEGTINDSMIDNGITPANCKKHGKEVYYVMDSPRTCTGSYGQGYSYCKNCELPVERVSFNTSTNNPYANNIQHTKLVKTSRIEATCQEDGYETYRCSACNYTKTYIGAKALGHSYSRDTGICKNCTKVCIHRASLVQTKQATCTNMGLKWEICYECEKTFNEKTIAALEHSYGSYDINGVRKCTRTGCNATQTCSHPSTRTYIYAAATCTQSGTNQTICNACNKVTKSETGAAALGHSYNEATCTLPKKCSSCGATEGTVLGHNMIAGTCEYRKCSRCSYATGNAEHNYSIGATCTSPKKCSRCGGTSGSALGHNMVAGSCEYRKCSRCSYATGNGEHNYSIRATCTSPKKCSRCGGTSGSALGHSWVGSSQGARCSRCGKRA